MADGTGIQWTDATWSPVLGCTPAGSGCRSCYAVRDVWRMAHNPNRAIAEPRAGLVEKTAAGVLRWTGKVQCLPEQLQVPLRWRRPRLVFVANQSDLFHPDVPEGFIFQVFAVMAEASQHTFQVLTKRPARARAFLEKHLGNGPVLRNVWLGYSASTQPDLDAGIDDLVGARAALTFLSLEPLVGPINLQPTMDAWARSVARGGPIGARFRWVIVGGESGPTARPCEVVWLRSIVTQCREAGVRCFVKQLGAAPRSLCRCGHSRADHLEKLPAPCIHGRTNPTCMDPDDPAYGCGCVGFSPEVLVRDRKGADLAEWPEDLRVREMPERSR